VHKKKLAKRYPSGHGVVSGRISPLEHMPSTHVFAWLKDDEPIRDHSKKRKKRGGKRGWSKKVAFPRVGSSVIGKPQSRTRRGDTGG